MSFGFQFVGTAPDVIRELKALDFDNNPQAEAVRAFTVAELEQMPANEFQNGVNVQAHGHYDSHYRNVRIEISQARVALPEAPTPAETTQPEAEASAEAAVAEEAPAEDIGDKPHRTRHKKAKATAAGDETLTD
jgi:hypothetical protein